MTAVADDNKLARLFQGRGSSASWRVRIALALKQVPYESAVVDVGAGETRNASYLAINPMGQVPTLEIDGLRLTQSVAVIEYLDETRPQPPLFAESAAARAATRQIVEIINSGIQPLHHSAILRGLKAAFGADEQSLRNWTQQRVDAGLRAVEAVLVQTAGRFCVGDSVSVADVFLYPQIGKLVDLGVEELRLPTTDAVMRNLRALPAFANSGPETV